MPVLPAILSLLFAAVAWGQTAAEPMRSRFQLVAGSNSVESFPVDDGATRVIVDVRQLDPTAGSEVLDGVGRSVATSKAVDQPVSHQDMSGTGDPFGGFSDVVAWDAPDAGEHFLRSPSDFVALVQVEGGAELAFWFDGLRGDRSAAKNRPLTLWATLTDAHGLPLDGATVTADVRYVANGKSNSLGKEPPWSASLTFARVAPGTYSVRIPGVPQLGTFHVGVTGEVGNTRRHLATSFNVWDSAPAVRTPTGGVPLVVTQDDGTGAIAEADGAYPGQIFLGPTDRADRLKPVIVFLHGWNSHTEIWDRPDGGFWHAALAANYRVASVGLHPDLHYLTNAAIVDHALAEITRIYDVKKVVIVAHSKGGVDADAALMLLNGADRATTMMTLSSPHFGTPLADVVDMLPDWLAGAWQNEAQEAMRVANMAMFRAQIGSNPNNARVDIRTFGAWGYDEVDFDGTWIEFVYRDITGPILKQLAGDNDGIVPYAASQRPGATTIFGGKPDSRTEVNHAQIRKRNEYWHHIQAQLLTSSWDNTPSPPVNLAAQLSQATPDTGSVMLTWESRSPFANSVRIERSVDGAPFVEIFAPVEWTYPVFIDFDVTAGHTYAYRVRLSVNDQWGPRWTSTYSSQVSVTFASPVPSAPSNLVATATSPTSIQLTWADNSNNETGFEIYRRVNLAGQPWAFVGSVGANVRQRTDGGLTPQTSYAYQVRAATASHVSAYSNVAVATTPAVPPLPLVAPSNLAGVYSTTTNRVTLLWNDNSSNEDGVMLQMSYGGGSWSVLTTVGSNVTAYTTGTFPPQYGWYSFRARAVRGSEVSAWSPVAQVWVAPPPQPFAPPSNLSGTYNPATNRVTLGWTDNAGNEDGFALQFSYGGTTWSDLLPATVGPNVVTYTTGTFPPQYGWYSFRVRAFRGGGVTAWSNVIQMGVFP